MLTILEDVALGFRDCLSLIAPNEIAGMLIVFTAVCFLYSFFDLKKL